MLFSSINGEDWEVSKTPNVMKPEITWEDGTKSKLNFLERPQIWLDKDEHPAMLFCAAQLKESKDSINLPFNVHIPLKKQ